MEDFFESADGVPKLNVGFGALAGAATASGLLSSTSLTSSFICADGFFGVDADADAPKEKEGLGNASGREEGAPAVKPWVVVEGLAGTAGVGSDVVPLAAVALDDSWSVSSSVSVSGGCQPAEAAASAR